MRTWILIIALVGCDKKPAPPKNEFEAFERKYVEENDVLAKALRKQGKEVPDKDVPTSYRAVYVGPPGVFVDRKLVATLPEMTAKHAELVAAVDANAKLLPTIGYSGLVITFDLGPEPASVAIETLRLSVGHTTYFEVRGDVPDLPMKASSLLCGDVKLRGAPSVDREAVQLSLLVDKDRTWVGLSRVNEFQEIVNRQGGGLDEDKLYQTLREHKASAFFADRNDVELAATGGTARDVIGAFDQACKAGFIDLAVLAPEQLAARPQL